MLFILAKLICWYSFWLHQDFSWYIKFNFFIFVFFTTDNVCQLGSCVCRSNFRVSWEEFQLSESNRAWGESCLVCATFQFTVQWDEHSTDPNLLVSKHRLWIQNYPWAHLEWNCQLSESDSDMPEIKFYIWATYNTILLWSWDRI